METHDVAKKYSEERLGKKAIGIFPSHSGDYHPIYEVTGLPDQEQGFILPLNDGRAWSPAWFFDGMSAGSSLETYASADDALRALAVHRNRRHDPRLEGPS